MKKRLLFVLPLLLLAVMATAETILTVQPITGADHQYALQSIGKICFADGAMCLIDKKGTELGRTPLAEISKIVFEEGELVGTEDLKVGNIHIWPNPTQESIIVSGMQQNQIIRVYNLNGQMLNATPVQDSQTTVNVSSLQSGVYLLQVGAEVVKFIKQ